MATTTHRHRAVKSMTKTLPFDGPVTWPGNPAAHGNITVIDRCKCGAWRAANVNGRHVERGEWETETERSQCHTASERPHGPTASEQRAAGALADAREVARAQSATLRHPSGRVIAASIADSGEIVLTGEHDPTEGRAIAAALPASLVEAAKTLRRLVVVEREVPA